MKGKYRLSDPQLAVIEADLASDNLKHQRRAQALKLLHEGHSVTAAAKALGVSRQAIYNWLDHYQITQNAERLKRELIAALIAALQEHAWRFEELHAALEQRLGRSVEPVSLRSWIMVARHHMPTLHPVVDLFVG